MRAARMRRSTAPLLEFGAHLLDLLLGLEDVFAVGPGHVLEALERIFRIGKGEADVVRERRLAVEDAHRALAALAFAFRAVQRVAALHAVRRDSLLDRSRPD